MLAWSHHDMERIDPLIIIHRLKVNPYANSVSKKRHKFNEEMYAMINKEVKKLLEA